MKTISNRDFAGNLDHYFGVAAEQEVRVRRGRMTYRIICEPPATEQPVLEPDDELRNSITGEELLRRFDEGLKKVWAERRKCE